MEELKRWRLILGDDKESEFDFDFENVLFCIDDYNNSNLQGLLI